MSRVTAGKNEVSLEFHQNDTAAVSLMEMRFHVPTTGTDSEEDPVQVRGGGERVNIKFLILFYSLLEFS